nr:isopeptide-forming domain-containing fimbrial protein [Enterococcus mundtii]
MNGEENPTNETDTDVDETPDKDPIKKIIDSEGKEVDLTQAKQGDTVEFVISNPEGVPYSAIGQKVTISDDLEDVLQLEDKTIKMEVADLGEDAEFKDVTDQGTLTTDDKTGKVSWTVDDGSLLAGKQYRLTIGGTVKEEADFSSYVDDSGNITIPNVAHQVIGETDKPTNEVNVVVEQEKPRILPPTGATTDHSNPSLLITSGMVIGAVVLGGVLYIKRKQGNSHENNH